MNGRTKTLTQLQRLAAGWCVCVFACGGVAGQQNKIRVAAAADLKFAMVELVQGFEEQKATKVEVTYGSSGNFFSQMENGAPFDIFFSADVDYPRRLAAAGVAEPDTCTNTLSGDCDLARRMKVDVARDGWKALLNARVQKIAIANPGTRPMGGRRWRAKAVSTKSEASWCTERIFRRPRSSCSRAARKPESLRCRWQFRRP
jgi:molybdate transport system substrate-binding protein